MPILHTESPRPLDVLGINATEEYTYRWLLAHPRATTADVAQAFELTSSKAQRILDGIEAKGLTTHSPERPRRYIPVSPLIAIEGLVQRRQEEIDRARITIPGLQQQMALNRNEQELMVELITDPRLGRQIYEQIVHAAQHDVAVLVHPPVLYDLFTTPDARKVQKELRSRGVRSRSINDAEFLSMPGAVDRIFTDMKADEEVKIFPHLPFKMILVDHLIAFIPLNPNQFNSPSLLVRHSALLDALYALFEVFWERSIPIHLSRTVHPQTVGNFEIGSNPRFFQNDQDLIQMLAAGLNDKKIADDLGISMRTLTRRIYSLTKSLDARTRFQAGWAAALRFSDATTSTRKK